MKRKICAIILGLLCVISLVCFVACSEEPDAQIPNPSVSTYTDEKGYIFEKNGEKYSLVGYEGEIVNLILPDNAKGNNYSISKNAFSNRISLQRIVLTEGVESIENEAFLGCYKLVEVVNESSLNVVAGSSDNGGVASYAKQVLSSQSEESDIIQKDGYSFYNDTDSEKYYLLGYSGNGTDLVLPDKINEKVYSIYQYAFRGNSKIKSIVIPDTLEKIGFEAFHDCTALETITLGSGIKTVEYEAFRDCTGLKKVTFAGTIDQWAMIEFGDSSANPASIINREQLLENEETQNGLYVGGQRVTAVTLTNATKIGAYAFYNFADLTSVTLCDGVNNLGNFAFSCTAIENIAIPDSVETIGARAFDGCKKLKTISIGSGIIKEDVKEDPDGIEMYAFVNCPLLEKIEYNGTKAGWKAIGKGTGWVSADTTGEFIVVCSDGNLTKEESSNK